MIEEKTWTTEGRNRKGISQLGLLALVVLVAAGLRIEAMASESLWLDELFTRYVVMLPFTEGMEAIRQDRVHPPLFYLVERVAVSLLGDGPGGLRTVSLASGLLLVFLTGQFASRLIPGNRWVGPAAALLTAVSSVQVYHATNARSNALYALEVLLLAWAFLRVMEEPGRPGPRLAFAALAGLAVMTHYLAALYLGALGAVALLHPERRRLLREYLILSLPAAVALGLWWLHLDTTLGRDGLTVGLGWIREPTPGRVAKLAMILVGRPEVPGGGRITLLAVLAIAVATVLAIRARAGRGMIASPDGAAVVAALVVLPPSALLLASLLTPRSYWLVRSVIPSQVFVAVALAMMVALLARWRTAAAVTTLVALVALNVTGLLLPETRFNPPFHLVAADLKAVRAAGELTLAARPHALWPLNYYLAGQDTARLGVLGPAENHGWISRPYPPAPAPEIQGARTIWLVAQADRASLRDSLLRTGWRVRESRSYPREGVPDLLGNVVITLEKLTRP